MKRFCLAVSVLMLAILGFAAFSWAVDATIFDSSDKYIVDSTEKVILKVYTSGGPTTYSAYLEVRNSVGTFATTSDYDPAKIVVTNVTTSTPATLTPVVNVYTLHNGDLSSPNIGVSFDDATGTLSVLCTNGTPGFHAMKYTIQNLALVACGSADGKTYNYGTTGYGSDTQCVGGTPSSTSFPTAGNSQTWTCSNSSVTSGTCSASQAAAPGACGTANGRSYPYGSTGYGSYTQCAPGTPSSTSFPTAGNSQTWTCSTSGGVSLPCSASQAAAVPGACGNASDHTYPYGSTGYGGYAQCAYGTPSTTAFPSAGNSQSWTCTNDGIASLPCSASQLAAPGACGTANKTYANGSSSYGTDTFCAPGTPTPSTPAFPAAGATVNWTCANGGVTTACSASQSSAPPALPDLYIDYNDVSGQTGGANNTPFSLTVTIQNIGQGDAGPFSLQVYMGLGSLTDPTTWLLTSVPVSGVTHGNSTTVTLSNLVFSSAQVHEYYNLYIRANASFTETSTTNNMVVRQLYIFR